VVVPLLISAGDQTHHRPEEGFGGQLSVPLLSSINEMIFLETAWNA
jgi:hypothetical protein